MSTNPSPGPNLVTAEVRLPIANWELNTQVTVPAGPMRRRHLLPLLQDLADQVVGKVVHESEKQGTNISCKKGCAACCRQLVPLSEEEARHVHDLVQALPEPRRSEILQRFAAARRRLEKAGLLDKLLHPDQWNAEDNQSFGPSYFYQGIACPFLEDESCSIYPDRPLICREFLVSSPAENCSRPDPATIRRLPIPLRFWTALAQLDPVAPGARFLRWVPLILAPEWAASHPEEPPPRPGPELLQEVFNNLVPAKDSPGPASEQPSGSEEKSPSAVAEVRTSYDDIPYTSKPFYHTHPDRLATLATLNGMTPAPVDRCRVLELGCGQGGNLLPMALSLPNSTFVGIDLSRGEIARGQEMVHTLGLTNIVLKPLSIQEVNSYFGSFDYIICHGVFSWVPPAVQDKILTICREHLGAQGVAYVSYNTYPGWRSQMALREALLFHVTRYPEPRVRLNQARAFLEFLTQAFQEADDPYPQALKTAAEKLKSQEDSYLFHEYLEEVNQPYYFQEFMRRAESQGLQFLEETLFQPLPSRMPPAAHQFLADLGDDLLGQEQYRDFLLGRRFRGTLLCHREVALNRSPSLETVQRLHILTHLRPRGSAGQKVSVTGSEEFLTEKEVSLNTNHPYLRAALHYLAEVWPRPVPFPDLWAAVQARLSGDGEQEANPVALAAPLLECGLNNLVELHLYPPQFVLDLSERPVASRLARLQAEAGEPITDLRHSIAELGALDQFVLR
ncbi:MAG: methyltransferase regulatory domain-containing protein, partial [Planctomycetes bacterium]|nr:methyltransferase regulatory domain-containing protein [Planctomycetota bacterium]